MTVTREMERFCLGKFVLLHKVVGPFIYDEGRICRRFASPRVSIPSIAATNAVQPLNSNSVCKLVAPRQFCPVGATETKPPLNG